MRNRAFHPSVDGLENRLPLDGTPYNPGTFIPTAGVPELAFDPSSSGEDDPGWVAPNESGYNWDPSDGEWVAPNSTGGSW